MKCLLEVCLVASALVVGNTPALAQPMLKGISVMLPTTENAVAMPAADQPNALIVAVTHNGRVYLGVDPVNVSELLQKLSPAKGTEIYLKADARVPYAHVAKVLEAAHAAGFQSINLITTQTHSSQTGTRVPPNGLPVLLGAHDQAPIDLQLGRSGEQALMLKIDDQKFLRQDLRSILQRHLEKQSEKLVRLKANDKLLLAVVVDVIDVCRASGAGVILSTAEK